MIDDSKEEAVVGAAKEVVRGLSDQNSAPWIMILALSVIFVVFVYILSPLLRDYMKEKQEADKYVVDTFNSQLKNTTSTIIKFDAVLAKVNMNLTTLQTKIDDTRTEQKNIRQGLNDHEKRIIKLEESK